jgi:hypothetical protein
MVNAGGARFLRAGFYDFWRVFPAMDIALQHRQGGAAAHPMGPMDGIEFLLDKLRQTKTNGAFFNSMNT